jgi:hypothetical protein
MIEQADIERIQSSSDIHEARNRAMSLFFASTKNSLRRAQIREAVMSKGTIDALVVYAWHTKLNQDGFGDPKTVITKRGVGYKR